jgi:hypothetical protein
MPIKAECEICEDWGDPPIIFIDWQEKVHIFCCNLCLLKYLKKDDPVEFMKQISHIMWG